jgi:hypothetical protein
MMNDRYSQPVGNDFAAVRTAVWQDTNRFKYIRISNVERTSGTPSNFQVNLGNDTILDRCEQIQLISASIPNAMYNISNAFGNTTFTIVWSVPLTTITYTFEPGQYTTAQIIAELNGAIVPPGGFTFLMRQDVNTGLIIVDSTGLFTIPGSTNFPTNPTSLNSYLGFADAQAPALQIVGFYRPSLFGSTMMYIHSPELGSNITYLDTLTTGGQTNDVNGCFTIPVNVPYNVMQTYQGSEEDRIVYGRRTRSVRNFSIVLRTNNGREMTDITDIDPVTIVLKAIFAVDQR